MGEEETERQGAQGQEERERSRDDGGVRSYDTPGGEEEIEDQKTETQDPGGRLG